MRYERKQRNAFGINSSEITTNRACASSLRRNQGVEYDPLSNLIDIDELEDSSPLDRIAHMTNIRPRPVEPEPVDQLTLNMKAKTRLLGMPFTCPSSVSLFDAKRDVRFFLYNKNDAFGVDVTDDLYGMLIPNAPIKFIIHGFLNSGNSLIIQTIKDAYMERDEDYNVIGVDWTKGSGTWLSNYFNCLVTSRIVPAVGARVAEFIVDLIEKENVNIQYVNIIGHSLGAQIAGRAGKKLIEMGHKLPIIVGLDPALPGFKYNSEAERLAPSDAEYVEVIHTNPGDLGFDIPLGTADFYPNAGYEKGNRQPGCITPACSHAKSFMYFAESIINPVAFEAVKCESYDGLQQGHCIRSGKPLVTAFMGGVEMRQGKASGVFKLETNKYQPYGRAI